MRGVNAVADAVLVGGGDGEDAPAQIGPSTCYAAKTFPAGVPSRSDAELTAMRKRIHAENYGVEAPTRSGTNRTVAACGWLAAPSSG